jgi:catechol 2,3-dioxygenase-like lactoylglutathione lyase family enzyme
MDIERIDHLVLTVSDVERTCEFYSQVLGLRVITFEGDRRALTFGEQKINLHQAGKEFEPHAAHPTPGSADFCFVTGTPINDVLEKLQAQEIEVVEGPVRRVGALGSMESVYFRDPDGNLIEVSNYPDAG